MTISKFVSKDKFSPRARSDEQVAAHEMSPSVVSLKSYRRAVARKARADARRALQGQVTAPRLCYVLLVGFFAGIAALAYGHNHFTGLSDFARSGMVVGSLGLLAWMLNFIFLDTFLLLVPCMIVIFGGTMMFNVWTEMSVVLVGVVFTNIVMQWIGWLE